MSSKSSKLFPILRAMDAYERRNAPDYRPLHLQYLRQQYLAVKRQYPDALVCFRIGDFYELFESDAETAAHELKITVTRRDLGWGKRTLMVGFPRRVAQGYIEQLVARGHRVAVCEQVSHTDEPAEPVTCHTCGAVVDGDALAVQMAADGSPKLTRWYCAAHLIAGLERLQSAIRAQREGEA